MGPGRSCENAFETYCDGSLQNRRNGNEIRQPPPRGHDPPIALMTRTYRIAVIIPASVCPCGQAGRVLTELTDSDVLVIVANGFQKNSCCEDLAALRTRVRWHDAGP